jgi:hypothetical protein
LTALHVKLKSSWGVGRNIKVSRKLYHRPGYQHLRVRAATGMVRGPNTPNALGVMEWDELQKGPQETSREAGSDLINVVSQKEKFLTVKPLPSTT